jgi:hypothetical protein
MEHRRIYPAPPHRPPLADNPFRGLQLNQIGRRGCAVQFLRLEVV